MPHLTIAEAGLDEEAVVATVQADHAVLAPLRGRWHLQ
jgi:hypothetical protein